MLSLSVSAQSRVKNQEGVLRDTKRQISGKEVGAVPTSLQSPLRALNHNFIGSTYYDCQTNGSMANRMSYHNDGTVSAVWTCMSTNINSRGTGYNYFDNGEWILGLSSSRIENVRTGWPTMTTVGNAEIVVSHNGDDGLIIGISPEKGSGEWVFSKLTGPELSNGTETSTCLLWPAIASSGNVLHLLTCTENNQGYLYNGIHTCLLYYRGTFNSNNNTITWEEPRIVGDVNSSEVERFSGDGYAIAAKGNHVAIVAQPVFRSNSFLWKSSDNGVNFTKTVFCEIANPGDTAYYDDGSYAVAIGDDGKVHIAGGTYMARTRPTGDTITWWPGLGYLYYWNDSMEPITYQGSQSFKDPEVLAEKGISIIDRIDLDGDGKITSVNFGADGYPEYGTGAVSMPQLVAQDGKVYMIFSQVLESLFVDANSNKYYRGIFGAKSTNDGESFGDCSWLSYNKDCFYISSFELFPLDTTVTLGDLLEYLENNSENVYPSVAPTIVNGNIAMTWLNDITAGSDIKDAPSNQPVSMSDHENYIYSLIMTADSIGIYNNTNEIWQGLWIDHTGISNNVISGMKIYPNPAINNVNITFTSEESAMAVVSIFNLMGQIVYTSNENVYDGYNAINVNVNNLPSGVYMVNVKTNRGTSTQKLIIK